jgi:hypothetical protein
MMIVTEKTPSQVSFFVYSAKRTISRAPRRSSETKVSGYSKPSPFGQSYKGLCRTKVWKRQKRKFVIWEIILRDFWGAILRPLVTPYRRSDANDRV